LEFLQITPAMIFEPWGERWRQAWKNSQTAARTAAAREFFTIPDFEAVAEALPDLRLELIHGEIVVNPAMGRDYFTIEEFKVVLVVEILSDSNSENLKRDLQTKVWIYGALEIPACWIVDRRDESVLVYANPIAGFYGEPMRYQGDQVLPAPGLDFLRITPAMIFAE
jgi:Uma2 family endonuclease